MQILIAHGALGQYDELIYLGIAAIFVTMMGVSWFQTRMSEYDDDQRRTDSPPEPATEPEIERSADRFTLD
jgi:hypothetical protein